MTVRFDYIVLALGHTYAVFSDVDSGSEISFDATAGGKEQLRIVRGLPSQEADINARLDALATGLRRQPE